jgi:DNA invertase Pin-like site-specific DNA recombinase
MPTKAVSYLRVSGKGQIDGDGFPRQREAIQRYAKAHRMTIVDEFTDGGVSGKNELEDRPGLGLLIFRIEQNGVRVVLVETAMRLARDLMVGEIILDRFRKLGVKVIEVSGGNDLTVTDNNPTSRLIRQILGAVAEFEKSVLVGKLRAARQRQRLKHGRCEGRKPFGTFPGEAEIVERIKDMRRKPRKGERLSFVAIAELLNQEGVPTRSGKPWRPSTVGNILGRE